MSCIPVPTEALPPLPIPFSIPALVVPPIGIGELTLCCKLPPIATPPIPIPIPSVLFTVPGLATAMSAAVAAVTAYINALPLKCPVE